MTRSSFPGLSSSLCSSTTPMVLFVFLPLFLRLFLLFLLLHSLLFSAVATLPPLSLYSSSLHCYTPFPLISSLLLSFISGSKHLQLSSPPSFSSNTTKDHHTPKRKFFFVLLYLSIWLERALITDQNIPFSFFYLHDVHTLSLCFFFSFRFLSFHLFLLFRIYFFSFLQHPICFGIKKNR